MVPGHLIFAEDVANRARAVGCEVPVSETTTYDEEPARRIRAISQTPAIKAQRERVIEMLAPERGWRALDVGCGPGHLARELAAAVGPGGRVCGADVSEHMLALANEEGQREVEYAHLSGTTLPFEDEAFDAAVATQVYEFVADLPRALSELHRV